MTIRFKEFRYLNKIILENIIIESDSKPFHKYKTSFGHSISVHLKKDDIGHNFAHFVNHSLGGKTTKIISWGKNVDAPSKKELEEFGSNEHEEEIPEKNPSQEIKPKVNNTSVKKYKELSTGTHVIIHNGEQSKKIKIYELLLREKSKGAHVIDGKMTSNTVGVVAEHATLMELLHHMHRQNGTLNSAEYKTAITEHQKAIDNLTKGVSDPSTVKTRIAHGKEAARLILAHVKEKHGENAKIENVGHTAREGDIKKFTKGIHPNDTQQTNKSDVGVEISGSKLTPYPANNKTGRHFEGYSLKSSAESSEITAGNPAIHLHGMLDTPNRKLNTDEISRESLRTNVHIPLGGGEKSAAEREREIDSERKKAGKSKDTDLELKASELGRKSIRDVTEEFHNHLNHLTNKEGNHGHALIANMLKEHLVSDSDMPWSKVKIKGDKETNVKGSLTEGSESPLKDILNNKNTKYYSDRAPNSPSVQVGYINPKTGERVALARYTPKTKSNAYKSNVHGWNIVPASNTQ